LTYNLLFLGAIAISGFCAYLLAWRLTSNAAASIVGGFVFAFGSYRFGHAGHLELQWTMWMPLAFLAIHGLVEKGRVRDGLALGASLALQAFSSVYYFIFLSIVLAPFATVAFAGGGWRTRRRLVGGITLAAVILVPLLMPYSEPYRRARRLVGVRPPDQVNRFSARPSDYLDVAPTNWLYPNRVASQDPDERSLYPGAVAPALALLALWPPVTMWRAAYAASLIVAFDASLGLQGFVFGTMRRFAPGVAGLRSAARFGVLVLLILGIFAAMGFARLAVWAGRRHVPWMAAAALAICTLEFWSVPLPLRFPPLEPPLVCRFLATQPEETVVLHLPVPRPEGLWGYETTYEYLSIFHWRRLVNGYSGFAPPVYIRTLNQLRTFPDAASIGRLRRLGVGFVIVHEWMWKPGELARLHDRMLATGAFEPISAFRDAPIRGVLYRLKRADEQAALLSNRSAAGD
jgi:hypothetical protein